MSLIGLTAFRASLKLNASQQPVTQFVRHAMKPWRRKRYYRGVYFNDGMKCHKDDVLIRMSKLNYYPGLNVSFRQEYDDKVLLAMCAGTVMITTEKINPDFAFPDIQSAYDWRKEQVEGGVTKLTVNVVPPEEIGKYRLKETV